MPSFNVGAALQAGYAPKEVLRHLASRGATLPYEGSDEDIIRQHLAASGDKVMLPYTYAPDLETPPPAAAPPPLLASAPMSGPPASVSGSVPQTGERRNLTPEEISALWAEPGITPTLPPLNAADLVMLGLSGPVESTGLPPTLLQMVRYKRPGVSALAQEAAAAYHQKPRVDPIGAKNTVFHATSPDSAADILRAGEIVPDALGLKELGLEKWDQLKTQAPYPYDSPIGGVSVSRVPRVASKASKAVSFVIDPERMGPARPFTEQEYRKTIAPSWAGTRQGMNPHFEFEDRTYNTAIPRSAVREMWVDKSALEDYTPKGQYVFPEDMLENLEALADQYGIPFRAFESGREMHAGRATLSSMAKKKK